MSKRPWFFVPDVHKTLNEYGPSQAKSVKRHADNTARTLGFWARKMGHYIGCANGPVARLNIYIKGEDGNVYAPTAYTGTPEEVEQAVKYLKQL